MESTLFRSRLFQTICLVFLMAMAGASYFEYFGDWRLFVFGIDYGWTWDPDSAYVGSGITLLDQQFTSFIGHPGLTLMWLIQAVTRIFYWISGAWNSDVSFHTFAAHNIFSVVLLCRFLAIVLSLVSIYAVYRLARSILDTAVFAELATLVYATTFPVLYYFNKVVPEAIFVSLAIAIWLVSWSIPDALAISKWAALRKIVVLALLYSAALITKLTTAFPLILFTPIMVAYLCFRPGQARSKMTWSVFWGGFSIFLIAALAFLVIGGSKMNWSTFFSFWFQYAPGDPSYNSHQHWTQNIGSQLLRAVVVVVPDLISKLGSFLFPNGLSDGLFQISESLVVLGALPGILWFCRDFPVQRKKALWLLLYGSIFLPAAIFRGGFHYFLVPLAVASLFFAYTLIKFIPRITGRSRKNPRSLSWTGLLCIIVVHGVSIAATIDGRRSEIEAAQSARELVAAAQDLNYRDRIGIVRSSSPVKFFGQIGKYIEYNGPFYLALEQTYYELPGQFTKADIDAWRIAVILSGNGYDHHKKTNEFDSL